MPNENLNFNAESFVRIIIKEFNPRSNWQYILSDGLPNHTTWRTNCFPGKEYDHKLIRKLSFKETNLTTDPDLLMIQHDLHVRKRNTSPIVLSQELFNDWYRFVNEKVWAKFHKLQESTTIDKDLVITANEWDLHQKVNKKFAKALARDILNDLLNKRNLSFDLNWLHDYQVMLVFSHLPHYLHSLITETYTRDGTEHFIFNSTEQQILLDSLPNALKTIKKSYFHHTPWPNAKTFSMEFAPISLRGLSSNNYDESTSIVEINPGKEIINAVLSSNHVSFQTLNDLKNFINCVEEYFPQHLLQKNTNGSFSIKIENFEVSLYVNPIGTDYELFAQDGFTQGAVYNYLDRVLGLNLPRNHEIFSMNFVDQVQEISNFVKENYFLHLINEFETSLRQINLTQLNSIETLQEQLDAFTVQSNRFIADLHLGLNSVNLSKNALLQDYQTISQIKYFKDKNNAQHLYLSIGRLDPEKNVPILLDAYTSYIEEHLTQKLTINHALLVFIVPSRLEVLTYQKELKIILEKFTNLEDLFTKFGLDPSSYVHLVDKEFLLETSKLHGKTPSHPKLVTPEAMSEFYRLGNITIASRADGMNLVIKEWVAAQDRIIKTLINDLYDFIANLNCREENLDEECLIFASLLDKVCKDKPKLTFNKPSLELFFATYDKKLPQLPILSRNAGAAAQLTAACIIDPLSKASIVEQFKILESMSAFEKTLRAIKLYQNVYTENAHVWREKILHQVGSLGFFQNLKPTTKDTSPTYSL